MPARASGLLLCGLSRREGGWRVHCKELQRACLIGPLHCCRARGGAAAGAEARPSEGIFIRNAEMSPRFADRTARMVKYIEMLRVFNEVSQKTWHRETNSLSLSLSLHLASGAVLKTCFFIKVRCNFGTRKRICAASAVPLTSTLASRGCAKFFHHPSTKSVGYTRW